MRDHRGRSSSPRRLGEALERALAPIAPQTPLGEIQRVWPAVVGPQITAVTKVIEERDGTVTIECENAVWANELEMMGPQLLEKLRPVMGDLTPQKLRFRA